MAANPHEDLAADIKKRENLQGVNAKVEKGKGNVSLVKKIGGIIANIIWFPLGLFLTIVYFLLGIIMILTIIGIPIGIVYVRMGKFILMPIGARVIFQKKQEFASAVVNEIEKKEKLNTAVKVLNI